MSIITSEIRKIAAEKKKMPQGGNLALLLGVQFVLTLGTISALFYYLTLELFSKYGILSWLTDLHFKSNLPTSQIFIPVIIFTCIVTFSGGIRLWFKINQLMSKAVAFAVMRLITNIDMYFWRKSKKDSVATNTLMRIQVFFQNRSKLQKTLITVGCIAALIAMQVISTLQSYGLI